MMSYDPRGIYSPDSIVWKIHSDPSMVIGGIRALFQQALHPVAMAGVATHSNFREDAWGRLQRTGDYPGAQAMIMEALHVYERVGDSRRSAEAHHVIGNI